MDILYWIILSPFLLLYLYYIWIFFLHKKIQKVTEGGRVEKRVTLKNQKVKILITLVASIPNFFVYIILFAFGFGGHYLSAVIISLVYVFTIWYQFSLIKKDSSRWYLPVIVLFLIWFLPSLPGLFGFWW